MARSRRRRKRQKDASKDPSPPPVATPKPPKEQHSKGGKKVLRFGSIIVRQHSRQAGGSGGVPSTGGTPLGLAWALSERDKTYKSIKAYENTSPICHERDVQESFPQLFQTESQRKSLLNKFNAAKVPKKASEEELAVVANPQLENLRAERENVGCDCTSGCRGKACACCTAGIECHEDVCYCTRETCRNPQGRFECNLELAEQYRVHQLETTTLTV